MENSNYQRMNIIISLVFLLWPLFLCAAEKEASVKKVAMVNGKIITQADVDREINIMEERFAQMGKNPNETELAEIKNDIIESLINFELLYQESQKKGIKIEENTLSEEFEKWKRQFPDENQFKKELAKLQLSEAGVKEQFRRGMAVQTFIDKTFGQKVVISEQETKAFYDSHPVYFKVPEQVHAQHILIKVNPDADATKKAEARKKIEEIQNRIKRGEDFAELAKQFSECPSSTQGGDLGYFSRGQMVAPFEKIAFSLKPGEISGVVETQFGFHLIKVLDKKPESTISYEAIKTKLSSILKQDKIQKETDRYLEDLKKSAKIEKYL
jgi:peptidyl-prolyl cis-trans isomerase C